jgi:hypothetical protein
LVITGSNATGMPDSEKVKRFEECPGQAYLKALQRDFASGPGESSARFLDAVNVKSDLQLEASPNIAANMALVDGKPHIFLANFGGLVPHKVAVPTAERGVLITLSSAEKCSLKFLPFLGDAQTENGEAAGQRQIFLLPPIERGAVVWLDECH